MDEKILINRKTLKAISSDTRFSILKLLNKKQKTLSEISKKLNLSAPTVKEHLNNLISADLIIKKETKRKWKYYYLTEKGKKLLTPKSVNILLAFAISLFSTIGVLAIYLKNIIYKTKLLVIDSPNLPVNNIEESIKTKTYNTLTTLQTEAVPRAIEKSINFNNINFLLQLLIITLTSLTILFLILFVKEKIREKKYNIKVIK
jgi:predicted ArsR family transcriptional regulator